jgi:glycosyltransferase involved in cell wall biosynthesis
MTRLRIALVFGRFEGGPARAALNGVLALGTEAYEHTVIAGAATAGCLGARAAALGIHVIEARLPYALADVLAAGGYDVVHTHDGTAGRLAAARARAPRIVHTWYDLPRSAVGERRAARHTDAFLAVGAQTASRALRLGLAAPERLRTIWPAVDLPGPGGTRARARRLLGLPLGARVVGSIGPVCPAKRPDVFARAIARLPSNVYGVWAGAEEGPSLTGRLTRRVADGLGAGDRMRWLGHRDDIADLLPGFDVLAMTGRREGVSCVALEATAAGVPLVGAAAACAPDVIRAGETGLLTVPGDPEQLARAIGYLLDHPAEARRMSRAALDRLADHCDPRSLAVTLGETYRGSRGRLHGT